MKHIIFILLLTSQCIWAQLKTYTFEDLQSLEKERPLVIFLHTDWCKFCKMMENTTFKNKEVIEKLNNQFYFVSFNAEYKAPINFQNHKFKYKSTGKNTGIHELAKALGTYKSKISYPTTIVLNTDKDIVFQHPYALTAKDFLNVLNAIK